MQSQWRVVERQDARGSEDRGQKTGGEDLAILPSFLHTFFYTRLLRLPTYSSNHTHRTTHRTTHRNRTASQQASAIDETFDADGFLSGRGVGPILAATSCRYRRPVK